MNINIKIVCAIALFCVADLAQAAPIPSAPVYSGKARFRIPFRYDPAEMQALGAREIRLFVSRDRGATWQQNQAVPPDAGRFSFQAPTDGEYWFVVKTLDNKDRLHPDASQMEPGLQVIVDTIQPRLKLELRQPSPGKVLLGWVASDEHLDPTQLRLEYTQPGTPHWQTVSVIPKATGQTEWSMPQGGQVSVRGSISDLSKNTAQDEVSLKILPADQTAPRAPVPDFRQPIASPGNNGTNGGNMALNGPNFAPHDAVPHQESSAGMAPESVTFEPIRSPSVHVTPAIAPSGSRPNSFTAHRIESPHEFVGDAALPIGSGRSRIVNNRKFQIGYKLQDVGPSGVSSIEMYITPDDGATWYKYSEDANAQSPAIVEVPKDGTYGFSIGVRSGVGLMNDPPQPGEKPSTVVVVDQTPPRIEMSPLEQGRGRAFNKLQLKWKYHDDNPAEKPISISYSATAQGPWQSIAGWQENSGSYIWTISPSVPTKFYLRIEARDAAGNTQMVETPLPVLIDLARPTARIIDVETTGGLR